MNCRTCTDGVVEGAGFLRLVCPTCDGVGRIVDEQAERAEKQRIYELTKRNNFSRENLQKRRGYK